MNEGKREKWIFIVNPVAGNGFAGTLVPEIEEMIKTHNADAGIILTEGPGHAAELSREYSEKNYRYIIGVGGDGTLNEVCSPLLGKKDVLTGIVPAGTGNDFIQILGFPGRFSNREWDILFNKRSISMDAGKVNGRIFLNGLGLGFDAQVAAENYTRPGQVKKGGAHKYIWHILKTLLLFREKKMTVTRDDIRHETNCFINTIAIGRRFAGGFFLTPAAIANDGLLDVCMIKSLNLAERLYLLMKVPKGEHITDRRVNYYQVTDIELEFNEEVPFHVDGELDFSKKFTVGIIPGAFNMIYNPDGPHFFRK